MRILTLALVLTLAGLGTRGALAAPTPSVEELWRIVQQQQKTIDQLSQKLDTTLARLDDTQTSLTAARTQLAGTEQKLAASEQKLADNTQKIEATADAVEAASARPKSVAASWAERTSIGGYGELHYSNLHDRTTAGDGGCEDGEQHRMRGPWASTIVSTLLLCNPWGLRIASRARTTSAPAGTGAPGTAGRSVAGATRCSCCAPRWPS